MGPRLDGGWGQVWIVGRANTGLGGARKGLEGVNRLLLFQEDLLTFVDVRTLKVKHEEQFKFEV